MRHRAAGRARAGSREVLQLLDQARRRMCCFHARLAGPGRVFKILWTIVLLVPVLSVVFGMIVKLDGSLLPRRRRTRPHSM